MLSAFRRKTQADLSPGVSEAKAADGPPPPTPALDGEMVDALEADILKAIQSVTRAISETHGDVEAATGDIALIHAGMGELAAAGQGAAAQTSALAASVEELASASGEIRGAMEQASARIGQAAAGAGDANALITELARATEEIVGIVDTIAAVARQTNLLALNATIEAARAGLAGRGFAVVASEVKALSVETGNAANDIRNRIERLRESAGSSIAAVERVVGAMEEVQPVFRAVRGAVDGQNASIGELARRAGEASSYVERVSARAQEVDQAAQSAAVRMDHAAGASARAAGLADGLVQRFTAVMRQNEVGDRRRGDRFPTDRRATVRAEGREAATATVDIGRGGFLLKAAPGLPARPGARLEAWIDGAGPLRAEVRGVSPMGLHCRLDAPEGEAGERYARIVAGVEEEYRPLIAVATDAASRVRMALEQAVADGRLTREALFDVDYRPIPGTDPQQFETRSLKVLEDILPSILEPLLISDNSMVFCIAVDRNGYIPVHNRRFSQPQRPGEPVWNTANCRNRRIFDDRAGIAAARSTRPFLVQAYARDMGGGQMVLMREVDAPIRVLGRHWGGFRTTYRL